MYISTKNTFKVAKTNINYVNSGSKCLKNFNFNHLMLKCQLWRNRFHKNCPFQFTGNCFEDNLESVLGLCKNKRNFPKHESQNLYKSLFLGDEKLKTTKYSSYEDLSKTIDKRSDAYEKGKVSRTYINKMCFVYEESTDEHGDKLQCNICLGELENGTEVCRLPCGHINCKSCIEGWFDIEDDDENSDQQPLIDETSNQDEKEIEVEIASCSGHNKFSEDDNYSENATGRSDENYSSDQQLLIDEPLKESDHEIGAESGSCSANNKSNDYEDESCSGNEIDSDNEIGHDGESYSDYENEYETGSADENDIENESCSENENDENYSENVAGSADENYGEYENEYEIGTEDEIELKRNRCPTCRHICS